MRLFVGSDPIVDYFQKYYGQFVTLALFFSIPCIGEDEVEEP